VGGKNHQDLHDALRSLVVEEWWLSISRFDRERGLRLPAWLS